MLSTSNGEDDERKKHTREYNKYLAEFDAAVSTPCGRQLNLYRSGTCESSGAGKPPQNDVNETMSMGSFFVSLAPPLIPSIS